MFSFLKHAGIREKHTDCGREAVVVVEPRQSHRGRLGAAVTRKTDQIARFAWRSETDRNSFILRWRREE